MGIEDLTNKATDALHSDKGEQASDAGLDKAADAASKASGGHEEQVDKARDAADEKIGN